MIRSRWLAVALAIVCTAARASAQDDARTLLTRAFENLYADDYVQTLELTTQAPGMRPLARKLQITRKQSVRPGKALVRFLEPFDVRRTSVLILENEGAPDDLYVYLPAVDLTRRVSAAQRADRFFGTDLSYEDIEPKRAMDYVPRLLPHDASSAESCVRLEIRAAEGFVSTYDLMVSCIEPERAVIRWTEFHRRGQRVKRLEIDPEQVRDVQGRSIPFLMTMHTLRTGSRTDLLTEAYQLAGDIPEQLFSTWNLQAGDAARDRARASGE